ncbi:MAG: exo-alpha-sialidase, partial [Fuerstiella sp.]
LWAICSRFGVGTTGRRFPGLMAEAFVLNEDDNLWQSRGIVMHNCWPYDEPVRMKNGSLITGGQDKDGFPVVAISQGDNVTMWDTVSIPFPSHLAPSFAETTVWADDANVLAVIRGGRGVAWVATSTDYGRNWTPAVESNLPMPRSKAYLGRLSSGELYLLSNFINRDTLVISVGTPDTRTLSRMYRIRDGKSEPPRFAGHAKGKQWSYPYGYEHDGNLYVVYSIGKEDCGLSILPISSLQKSPLAE